MFGADPSLKQLPVVSLALVPQKYRDTTESDPNRSVECVVFLARIAWFFVLVSSTSVRSKRLECQRYTHMFFADDSHSFSLGC
jgi:hypothetical protein